LFAQHNLAAYQTLAPLLDKLSADSILAAWQQLGWQPQVSESGNGRLAGRNAGHPAGAYSSWWNASWRFWPKMAGLSRSEAGWRLQKDAATG
jgi:hypothetical protein